MDPAVRRREPELMDDAGLDAGLHASALAALARVNRVSGTAARAWREVRRLWEEGRRPVRVLDVACGGGDVLGDLAERARRARVGVDLVGCDVSARALEIAGARAADRAPDAAGPRFVRLDVLADALPDERDLVLCTLFLHHLAEDEAVRLLASMANACTGVLLVQDLRRTRRGYALAWLGLHTLARSSVARVDGLASVRASFSMDEARELARRAGLHGAEVRACWPQRFALRWAVGPARA